MKTVMEIAKSERINKVCVDGHIGDIRQYDKTPFDKSVKSYEIIDSIYNEKMLICQTVQEVSENED